MKTLKVIINNNLIIRSAVFILTLSLFFDSEWDVYVFYTGFLIFIIISSVNIVNTWKSAIFPKLILRLLLFTLLAGLSYFWSIDKGYAINMFMRLLIICLILVLITLNNRRFYTTDSFTLGLVTGVIINLILLIIPTTRNFLTGPDGRFNGSMHLSNHLSIMVFFSIYFLYKYLSRKEQFPYKLYLLFVILAVIVILSTQSRKGVIFGIGIIFLTFYYQFNELRYRRLLIIGTLILSVPIFYLLIRNNAAIDRFMLLVNFLGGGEGDSSIRWRLTFIIQGIEIFKENPLFGVGIDNFQTFTSEGLYAHNNYVEILADLGIAGFVLLYSIYINLFRNMKKVRAVAIDYWFLILILVMEVAHVSYYFRPSWIALLYFYFEINRSRTQNVFSEINGFNMARNTTERIPK